ncbi:hypothetical protein COB52_01060 [Candidatus Kaiserbacteria bacterium]|nr:MAG: hypothetical protein COB52_01060 [Candidatus Kaiserbacteria bacterium]
MYDLTIIGGGPAGVSAGIYSARKQLKTLFITQEWGGQSNVSADIQNWIGFPHISGTDLAKKFEEHLREYAGEIVDIVAPAKVTSIVKIEGGFKITSDKGEEYESKAVFLSMGSHRRRLQAEGADKFEHKGLTYCATCDGPIFSGKDVVVVGGGNAGFETAAQLLEYTNSVTLIQRKEKFLADEVTVAKVSTNEKFTGIANVEITEVLGENMVSGIKYKDKTTGEEKEMEVGGIFVEIGMVPNTDIVSELIELNERKHVVVDPLTQRTSVEGIWAAGDCTDGKYHQNNIAAGDAVKAVENMHGYLR